jgi:hypothetical protein
MFQERDINKCKIKNWKQVKKLHGLGEVHEGGKGLQQTVVPSNIKNNIFKHVQINYAYSVKNNHY